MRSTNGASFQRSMAVVLFCLAPALLSGCGNEGQGVIGTTGSGAVDVLQPLVRTPAPPVYQVFGVDVSNQLFTVSSSDFNTVSTIGVINNLQPGENVLGVSFSPEGALYALGSTSRIYTIDTTTGNATEVGTGPFTPALNGTHFGFSFSPVTYHLRITSDAGQNFRINSSTGTLADAEDAPLSYDLSDVNAGATPSVVTTSSSCSCEHPPTVYGIDSVLGVFVSLGSFAGSQSSPNLGQLFTLGPIGFDVSGRVALTLPNLASYAFAAAASGSDTFSKIYSIQLDNGTSTFLGDAVGLQPIQSLSVLPYHPAL